MLEREPDIELMLLDINMPVMDGLTLLSELRTRQSPVRAIIVSAYGDMANIRTAMNRGAFDFVTKPVDLNDLELTIRKTLDEIAASARSTGGAPPPSGPAAIFRAISRRTWSRCWPNATSRSARCGGRPWPCCSSISSASRAWPRRCRPRRWSRCCASFHERMTAQIFACGGTVEKYIGDAIFAVFGLPSETREDAAQRAALRRGHDRRARATGTPSAYGKASRRSLSASASITARP